MSRILIFHFGKRYKKRISIINFWALETLINISSIGEDQEDMFFIYPENNAVVRLDVKAYKYTFTKKGIIADCENIFCR